MIVIGIVGGIASGKSLVADCFRRLGAEVIQADQLGHEVLEEPEVRDALGQRWGAEVFDAAGRLDRKEIARIVFSPPPRGPRERVFLERLTHPRIAARMRQRLTELAGAAESQESGTGESDHNATGSDETGSDATGSDRSGGSRRGKIVLLDAPVLLEAGWDEYCDKIVYVEAARPLRLQRALERGWTEAEFSAREAAQKSLDDKRNCADWVIDNSHSPSDTFQRVQQFWRSLS